MGFGRGIIRVAIVGCGRAAQQHSDAIALAGADGPHSGRVVALVDRDHSLAEETGQKMGCAARGLSEVLADPEIDVVSICTPPGAHAEIAVAALEAKKGVMIEKPVTPTVEELDRILTASATSGAPVLAMLQHRGRLPKEALAKEWTSNANATVEVIRPRPRKHYQSEGWRNDPDQSGGGHLAHLGVHYIDLACQALGMPIKVTGVADCPDVLGIDTRAALSVQFESGALMSVLASSQAAMPSERLHIFEGERDLLLTDKETQYQDGIFLRPERLPTPQLRASVYRDLWRAVRGGKLADIHHLGRARGVTIVLAAVRILTCAMETQS